MLTVEWNDYSYCWEISDDKHHLHLTKEELTTMQLTPLSMMCMFQDVPDFMWWRDVFYWYYKKLCDGDLSVLFSVGVTLH